MQIRGREEREEQSLADQSTCPGGGIAEAPERQGKHSSGWLENVLAQCPAVQQAFPESATPPLPPQPVEFVCCFVQLSGITMQYYENTLPTLKN